MILDARHEQFRVSVDCKGSTVVGAVARSLWTLFKLASGPARNETLVNELQSGDLTLTLEEVEKRITESVSTLGEEGARIDSPADITLWWIRKPVPRDLTLKDKFGTNERTKCVVVLAPESSTEIPTVPVWQETSKSQVRAAKPGADAAIRVENARKRAIENVQRLLTSDELDALNTSPAVRNRLDANTKRLFIDVCLEDKPVEVLKKLMESDVQFRRTADDMLIAVGKARRDDDGVVRLL